MDVAKKPSKEQVWGKECMAAISAKIKIGQEFRFPSDMLLEPDHPALGLSIYAGRRAIFLGIKSRMSQPVILFSYYDHKSHCRKQRMLGIFKFGVAIGCVEPGRKIIGT